MTNPFDDAAASFHVLVNVEGQHSLWPSRIPVPDGWTIVVRDCPRAECVSYVEAAWTDLRPRSVVEAMRAAREEQA